jgi:hypothetical protein
MPAMRNEQALIALVVEATGRKRSEILEAARSETRDLVRSAHARARAAMRRALEDERRLERQRVGAAEANLETRQRLALQRRNAALVAAAWRLLPEVLLARWRDPSTRERWVDRVIESACAALPAGRWRIAHPVGWPSTERDRAASRIRELSGTAPEWFADMAVSAGLRIEANGTVVDGTIAALLDDRSDIAAALLHVYASLEIAPGDTMR